MFFDGNNLLLDSVILHNSLHKQQNEHSTLCSNKKWLENIDCDRTTFRKAKTIKLPTHKKY